MDREQLTFVNTLLFETPGGLRFTQDSPILTNVWLAYADEPRSQQELILTVTNGKETGKVAQAIRSKLNTLRENRPDVGDGHPETRARARVSYIPGQIAVKLYFDELMRVVLPLTPWFQETYHSLITVAAKYKNKADPKPADWGVFPQPDSREGRREQDLVAALMLMRREIDPSLSDTDFEGGDTPSPARIQYIRELPADLSWFVRIAGVISECFFSGNELLGKKDSEMES